MPILGQALVLAVMMLVSVADDEAAPQQHRAITVTSAEQLQRFFAEPVDSVHVTLAPGRYELDAVPYTDPVCGNCPPDAVKTPSETTIGLHIRGTDIRLSGPPAENGGEAIIHTGAGYGLLIEDASNVLLERLTITGGERSEDARATDAAVVVRRADVRIEHCVIRDNLGREEIVRQTVSGVAGIAGREHAELTIKNCRIIRNSWDGIALYRDAQASIADTIVDGVDKATGATIGGGRGVGIGVTWNAHATVRGTLIRRYWKGLGIFVNADVTAEEVIVEDIVTWGIALWGAGAGTPAGHVRRCAIYNTGACGMSITSASEDDEPGELTETAIVKAGQDERYDAPDRYCLQCPIAIHRRPDRFEIHGNLLHANRRVDCDDDAFIDLADNQFRQQIRALWTTLHAHETLRESDFLKAYKPDDGEDD